MLFPNGIRGGNVFFSGSGKNAGKTTFMNYAVRLMGDETVGVMSIGIDGERFDGLSGAPKPKVYIKEGDLFVCSEKALEESSLYACVLKVFPFSTALGKPMICRAIRPGNVEISGPENNSQLKEIIETLRKQGAGTVFIDGAADRFTQTSGIEDSVFVHIARISPENLASAAEHIKLLYYASQCAEWKEGREDAFFIKGALTPEKIPEKRTGEKKGVLILEDITKIFLKWREWKKLNIYFDIFFLRRHRLAAVVINLYDISREEFEKTMPEEIKGALIYNPYAV